MQELMIFQGKQVEVFEHDGQVLFNPYHCGECLDLSPEGVRKAITRMNEKQVIKLTNSKVTDSNFRKLHNTGENFLTESGVYKLIFKSHKAEAEKFQDWVTDEVLPSIRKHGAYMTEETIEQAIMSPDFLIKLATELKSEQQKNKQLNEKIQEDKSKVLFSEAVENSEDLISVKEMATLITQTGYEIGQNELYKYLRNYEYLCSKKGSLYHLPTRRYEKYFKVTKRTIQGTENIHVKNTPKVTGIGQMYFIKKFAEYKLKGIGLKELLKEDKRNVG